MYFDKETIEATLNCINCNKRYDVPRVLPCCGESICTSCVNSLKTGCCDDKAGGRLTCPFCKKSIQIPENNFPIEKVLNRLLNLKPVVVSRGEVYDKTVSVLNKLLFKLNDLSEALSNRESKLINHFDFIKNELDINCESAIERIHRLREGMFNEIDDYKQKCEEKLQNLTIEQESCMKEFLSKNVSYLETFKKQLLNETNLKDTDLEKFLNEARFIFKDINVYEHIMNYELFDGKMLYLSEDCHLSDTTIATLNYKTMPKLFDIERFIKSDSILFKFDIKSNLTDEDSIREIRSIKIGVLNGSKFLLVINFYSMQTSTAKLYVYDLNVDAQKVTCLKSLAIEDSQIEEFQTCENWILCQFLSPTTRIAIYDDELNFIRRSAFDYQVRFFSCSNEFIYIQSDKEPFVHVYDWNFIELRSFGQSTKPDEPFYMPNLWRIYVNDTKLVFVNFKNSQITIQSEKTGKTMRTLNIDTNESHFTFDSLLRIFKLHRRANKMTVYNVDFDVYDSSFVVCEKDLSSHLTGYIDSFIIDKNGNLIICGNYGIYVI